MIPPIVTSNILVQVLKNARTRNELKAAAPNQNGRFWEFAVFFGVLFKRICFDFLITRVTNWAVSGQG
jgi:hypothetical protein